MLFEAEDFSEEIQQAAVEAAARANWSKEATTLVVIQRWFGRVERRMRPLVETLAAGSTKHLFLAKDGAILEAAPEPELLCRPAWAQHYPPESQKVIFDALQAL